MLLARPSSRRHARQRHIPPGDHTDPRATERRMADHPPINLSVAEGQLLLKRAENKHGEDLMCALRRSSGWISPRSYVRDSIPKIERYPGGQIAPTPDAIDFIPGTLLGSVSGGLGLRRFVEGLGHTFIVTSDKEGENSVFERELPDADIVISQPFWPAYLTAERIARAKTLKLAITAGIGSDHVDLQAAIDRGITVAEVTYSNSISVSEHVVMMILGLVRSYIPSYQWVVKGGWNIADCVTRTSARSPPAHRPCGASQAQALRHASALL